MAKQVRLRRGTTAQHATFTGADGEITFDTDKKCVVTHDGVTVGGVPLTGWVKANPGGAAVEQGVSGPLRLSGLDAQGFGLIVMQKTAMVGALDCASYVGALRFRRLALDLSFGPSVALHENYDRQHVTLAGDLVLTCANYDPGSHVVVVVVGDGSARNLTFPAGWRFVGGARPATLAANKVGLLDVFARTYSESGVVARWSVEP